MSNVLPDEILSMIRRILPDGSYTLYHYQYSRSFGDQYADIKYKNIMLRIGRDRGIWSIDAGPDTQRLYDTDLWSSYLDGSKPDKHMTIDDEIHYISSNLDRLQVAIKGKRKLDKGMEQLKYDRAKARYPDWYS